MLWKSRLFLTLCVFTLQASQTREFGDLSLAGLRDVKYRHFLDKPRRIRHVTNLRAEQDRHRTKRSLLLSNGIKVCPQETLKAIVGSHRAYYKLRVCQEAIWEAFRIFFDRVPDSKEYGLWVYSCQHQNLCMDDLAHNFSNSQEHLDLLARRVTEQVEIDGTEAGSLELDPELELNPKLDPGIECIWTSTVANVKANLQNNLEEYIVVFSVTIIDLAFNEHLSGPEVPQYGHITQELTQKMLHVFKNVPGFRDIRFLGFRSEDVSARYAVVFNRERELNDDAKEFQEPDVKIDHDVNVAKLKNIIVTALKHWPSLPVDIQTLSFDAVTTVFPMLTHSMNPAESALTEDRSIRTMTEHSTSIPIFFQTVGHSENSFRTLTVPPFVPAIKPVFPKAAVETPLFSEVEEFATSGDQRGQDIMATYTEEIPEVEAIPANGRDNTDIQLNDGVMKNDLKAHLELEEPTAAPTSPTTILTPVTPTTPAPPVLPASTSLEVRVQGLEPDRDKDLWDGSEDSENRRGGYSGATAVSTEIPAHNSITKNEAGGSKNSTDAEKFNPPGEESGTGFASEWDERPHESTAAPAMKQGSTPMVTAVQRSKELVVFFSLRVTNMMFSGDLFNKNSPEYKSLENTFLELLLPYLESNLTGFRQLEILNFRNGSVVVNSKMKLDKPVPYNVTEAVHCVLEDFCNAASKRLDIKIDSRSLKVEPADQGEPCKFLACGDFSHCVVNSWTGETECRCDPGYRSEDGTPCLSICRLQPDYCLNGGLCEVIPGHGATCRCPKRKYWHYHGEHCGELVSMPVDPSMIITCLLGSLCLVCAVLIILIFINRKCIATRKAVTFVSPDNVTQPDQKLLAQN